MKFIELNDEIYRSGNPTRHNKIKSNNALKENAIHSYTMLMVLRNACIYFIFNPCYYVSYPAVVQSIIYILSGITEKYECFKLMLRNISSFRRSLSY